jgi:cholest-4-en-3-one 26-monooxygenase
MMTNPEINLIDDEFYETQGPPYEQFRWLRENAPVYRHDDPRPGYPEFWALTRFEDVTHVSRHSDLFSSSRRLAMYHEFPPESFDTERRKLLYMDPPEHTRQRAHVNRGFTARAVDKLRPKIQDICRELVEPAVAQGAGDFVRDIALPLPLYVICEILGVPGSARSRLIKADGGLGVIPGEVYQYAAELAAGRRERSADDPAGEILRPDENGEILSDDEFKLFAFQLVVAGNESTRNAASGGLQAFFDHPDQWKRLREDRSLLATAPDEMIRWSSPINLFRRTATTTMELHGQVIREDDKVVIFYASANRDADVFDEPDVFDIARNPNPHAGFGGGGAHFCPGTSLARLQLTVLLQALLDCAPSIEAAGTLKRLPSSFINGVVELPVRYGRG